MTWDIPWCSQQSAQSQKASPLLLPNESSSHWRRCSPGGSSISPSVSGQPEAKTWCPSLYTSPPKEVVRIQIIPHTQAHLMPGTCLWQLINRISTWCGHICVPPKLKSPLGFFDVSFIAVTWSIIWGMKLRLFTVFSSLRVLAKLEKDFLCVSLLEANKDSRWEGVQKCWLNNLSGYAKLHNNDSWSPWGHLRYDWRKVAQKWDKEEYNSGEHFLHILPSLK